MENIPKIIEDIHNFSLDSLKEIEEKIIEYWDFEENKTHCPIWNVKSYATVYKIESKEEERLIRVDLHFSPRAGGWYFVERDIYTALNYHLNQSIMPKEQYERKTILTDLLVKGRKEGYVPVITSKKIEETRELRIDSVENKIYRLLKYLSKIKKVGDPLIISFSHPLLRQHSFKFSTESRIINERIMAETGVSDTEDFRKIVSHSSNKGLIKISKINGVNILEGYRKISLTNEGERLAKMNDKIKYGNAKLSTQIFVSMWFDKKLDNFYEELRKGIEEAGYNPFRLDDKYQHGLIHNNLIKAIKNSRFMIADLTGNRGGVYHEAGFAHAREIPVIFTCSENEKDNIHFNVKHHNHIFWKPDKMNDFIEEVKDAIRNLSSSSS